METTSQSASASGPLLSLGGSGQLCEPICTSLPRGSHPKMSFLDTPLLTPCFMQIKAADDVPDPALAVNGLQASIA